MTRLKTGSSPRRGFLARLAAIGTVLGGVVPELRAYGMTGSAPQTPPNMGSTPGMGGSTGMPTNPSMPPTTPDYNARLPALSPSASALLYSSALTDTDVRALLAHVERGATLMPVQSSADLGGGGQVITLPIRGSSGITTAVVLYGLVNGTTKSGQPSALSIRVLLKSDSTMLISHAGIVVPASPDATSAVQLLNLWAFPEEYRTRRMAEISAAHSSSQTPTRGWQTPSGPWMPPPRSQCLLDWRTCRWGAGLAEAAGDVTASACILLTALLVAILITSIYGAPAATAAAVWIPITFCSVSVAGLAAVAYWQNTCDNNLYRCLNQATY
jgi:hypothetical protein